METNIINLGITSYKKALEIQKTIFQKKIEGGINNTLFLLEHPPVLTLGTRGNYENIYISKEELSQKGVEIYEVNRGGDVTYHGLGQIVGYFIFDLRDYGKDVRLFVQKIEKSIINLLKDNYNIEAYSESGKYTGVWTGGKKIAAIGISVSKWITMHGFAFNVNTDLDHFKWINPCGLSRGVTSIKELSGREQDMGKTYQALKESIIKEFGLNANDTLLKEIIKDSNE